MFLLLGSRFEMPRLLLDRTSLQNQTYLKKRLHREKLYSYNERSIELRCDMMLFIAHG